MNTLISDFINYTEKELMLSAHTVKAYEGDLSQWYEFSVNTFGNHFDIANVVANDLRLWVAHLAETGLTAKSIRRKIQTLRAFYRFMMRRRGMETNPAMELVPARLPKSLPDIIPSAELASVLNKAIDESNFIQVRDRLILTMLYSTGLRASELISLKNADVDLSRGELKVLGKRNKERTIPFGKELMTLIVQYRKARNAQGSPEFFQREDGSGLTYQELLHLVHLHLDGRVNSSKRSPHVLRHCFATDMLNNGAEITAVQQLLGHASLATTQIYTHLSYKELLTNYQQAHPRAQKKG